MLKVDSIESLRHAKMFVRIIRKRENIKSVSQFVRIDYVSIYSAKDTVSGTEAPWYNWDCSECRSSKTIPLCNFSDKTPWSECKSPRV